MAHPLHESGPLEQGRYEWGVKPSALDGDQAMGVPSTCFADPYFERTLQQQTR